MTARPVLLFTVAACVSLQAQVPPVSVPAQPLPGNEAVIARKAGAPSTERILSADAAGISVLSTDGRGIIKLPYDQVVSVRFSPPAGWEEITKLIKQGKVTEVEAKMLPVASRMAQMTSVKGGDASKYVFAYTDVLRSLGKYQPAVDFLDKAPFPADAPVVDRARRLIVKAYCLVMLGKTEEAEKMLNQVQAPGDKSSLFTIYQLARSRVYAERKDILSSLDDIARVIAVKRLGSESYDEALYQSAETYDALGRLLGEQKQAVEKNDGLRRQMQQDTLDAIARFEVIKSDPLQVNAIWDAGHDYVKCAESARLQLCRVYPNSPWTVKAREKLTPEARQLLAGEAVAKVVETPAEKTDGTPRKDRTGRDEPKAESGGEILKLDESTDEKDP